jgi:hypothetical protein
VIDVLADWAERVIFWNGGEQVRHRKEAEPTRYLDLCRPVLVENRFRAFHPVRESTCLIDHAAIHRL